jgi:hypothetical protein
MNPEENEGVEIPGEGDEWTPEGRDEERAAQTGWRPEHLFDGDPDVWVDAREFNVRGELMGKIQGMGRKLSGYEKEIADLREVQKKHSDMTKSMVESTYKKALADIKRDKREAMELGDYDAVDDLDERAEAIRGKSKELEDMEATAPAPVQFNPATAHPIERAFVDIVATTPELRGSKEKTQELGNFADALWASNPEISVLDFNAAIAKELKPAPRGVPGPGARGTGRAPRSTSRYNRSDLSEMEVEFAKTFVETGAYKSIQEYIDDAAKSNSLEIQQR